MFETLMISFREGLEAFLIVVSQLSLLNANATHAKMIKFYVGTIQLVFGKSSIH